MPKHLLFIFFCLLKFLFYIVFPSDVQLRFSREVKTIYWFSAYILFLRLNLKQNVRMKTDQNNFHYILHTQAQIKVFLTRIEGDNYWKTKCFLVRFCNIPVEPSGTGLNLRAWFSLMLLSPHVLWKLWLYFLPNILLHALSQF